MWASSWDPLYKLPACVHAKHQFHLCVTRFNNRGWLQRRMGRRAGGKPIARTVAAVGLNCVLYLLV